MIAALYVLENGPYFGLPAVDPWPESRDARAYTGPWPVVAHPPCARWGRYWGGGPMLAGTVRQKVFGDDGGCFAAALAAVRRWGGVLEHPEASHAWRRFDLMRPPKAGGWISAGLFDPGWTCCVEQGHYGHRARKATWLYAVGTELPSLRWGPAPRSYRLDLGFHSAEERRMVTRPKGLTVEQRARRRAILEKLDYACPERLNKREMMATPEPFRDLLLSLARSVDQAPPHP